MQFAIMQTGHVSSTENPADLCTKFIPGGKKHDYLLIGLLLHDIVEQI